MTEQTAVNERFVNFFFMAAMHGDTSIMKRERLLLKQALFLKCNFKKWFPGYTRFWTKTVESILEYSNSRVNCREL